MYLQACSVFTCLFSMSHAGVTGELDKMRCLSTFDLWTATFRLGEAHVRAVKTTYRGGT